jgi:hypothetical protein
MAAMLTGLSLVVSLAFGASPRALPHADLVAYSPRLSALSGLSAFLAEAGPHSPLFRASAYTQDFHPFLAVDPLRPESLKLAGMDPNGPATRSDRGTTHVTCTALADPKTFETVAREHLAGYGEVTSQRTGGFSVVTAKSEARFPAGYLLKGKEACSFSGTDLTKSSLDELIRWMGKPPSGPAPSTAGLSGALWVWSRDAVAGIDGKKDELTVDMRATSTRMGPSLEAASPTALAAVPRSGAAYVLVKSNPTALAATVHSELSRVCQSCRAPAWDTFFSALGPALTGQLLARVDRIQVSEPLSAPTGRFSSLKQAALLELVDAEKAKAAIEALAQAQKLAPHGDGVELSLGGTLLAVGVRGNLLYLSSDEKALAALGPAFTAKPTLPAHSLDLAVDPRALAGALGQISLLDVVADKELVGLFALSTQVGSLLNASDSIRLWGQPETTGARLHMTWRLGQR